MLASNGRKSNNESYRAEHDRLVEDIIKSLSATRLGKFWSQPTGAAFRHDTIIRYGVIGSADISGIMVGGKRIEIEVKTGKAQQSEQQKNFQSMINMMGGFYFVARSVSDAVDFVKSVAASLEM